MAIWISWNIDTPRSLNSHDSFPIRKFENRAPNSCRAGPILSLATISFELHANMAEKIDLEMCSYGQFSEVQMLCDLDLGSGKVTSTYTVRVALPAWTTVWCSITQYRNMVIWISWNIDIRRSLNSLLAFLEGNSKIGLRQAVYQVQYCYH